MDTPKRPGENPNSDSTYPVSSQIDKEALYALIPPGDAQTRCFLDSLLSTDLKTLIKADQPINPEILALLEPHLKKAGLDPLAYEKISNIMSMARDKLKLAPAQAKTFCELFFATKIGSTKEIVSLIEKYPDSIPLITDPKLTGSASLLISCCMQYKQLESFKTLLQFGAAPKITLLLSDGSGQFLETYLAHNPAAANYKANIELVEVEGGSSIPKVLSFLHIALYQYMRTDHPDHSSTILHIKTLIKYGAHPDNLMAADYLLYMIASEGLAAKPPFENKHTQDEKWLSTWQQCVLSYITGKRTVDGLQAIIDEDYNQKVDEAIEAHAQALKELPEAFHREFHYTVDTTPQGIKINTNTDKMIASHKRAIEKEKQALRHVWSIYYFSGFDPNDIKTGVTNEFNIAVGTLTIPVTDCLYDKLAALDFDHTKPATDEINKKAIAKLSETYISVVKEHLSMIEEKKTLSLPEFRYTKTLPDVLRNLIPTATLKSMAEKESVLEQEIASSFSALSDLLAKGTIRIKAHTDGYQVQYIDEGDKSAQSVISEREAALADKINALNERFDKRLKGLQTLIKKETSKYIDLSNENVHGFDRPLSELQESRKQMSITRDRKSQLKSYLDALTTLIDNGTTLTDLEAKASAILCCKALYDEEWPKESEVLKSKLKHVEAVTTYFNGLPSEAQEVAQAIFDRFRNRKTLSANVTKWISEINQAIKKAQLPCPKPTPVALEVVKPTRPQSTSPKVATTKPTRPKTPCLSSNGITVDSSGHTIITNIIATLSMMTEQTECTLKAQRAVICHYVKVLLVQNPGSKDLLAIHNKLGHHIQFDTDKVDELTAIMLNNQEDSNAVIIEGLKKALSQIDQIYPDQMQHGYWDSLEKSFKISPVEQIAELIRYFDQPMPEEASALEYYHRLDALSTLRVLYENKPKSLCKRKMYWQISKKVDLIPYHIESSLKKLIAIRNDVRHSKQAYICTWNNDYSTLKDSLSAPSGIAAVHKC